MAKRTKSNKKQNTSQNPTFFTQNFI